jgi:signal transduction histidine kinase/CHASE1-domain containing sensor protein
MPNLVKVKGSPLKHPALWGILISLLSGTAFYYATYKSIESNSSERFLNISKAAQNTISARIKAYTNVLRATTSLFQSSERVSRLEFHRFVEGLSMESHYPAIVTLNFAYYFTDAERDDMEKRLHEEQRREPLGEPWFAIKPPGRRPNYAVITYIEPGRPTDPAFGFDMQSNPKVEKALARTRDNGLLQTSGEPIPAISSPNRVGLGMRMPVYRANMPSQTIAEKRAAYIGSVGIAFSVPQLVQGVLAEMPIKNVRMRLIDLPQANAQPGAQPQSKRLMFDSRGTAQHPDPPPDAGSDYFVNAMPVDFNGRLWIATFSTKTDTLYTKFDHAYPKLAAVFGFIGALAVYSLFYSLTSSRRRAVAIAAEMTKELRDSEARLQNSHDSLQRLAAHADHIKENERRRIAREIHDELGQNLLALRIEADMLAARTHGNHSHLHERARWTLLQIDRTIKSVRQIINDLRPNVLDLGLSAAVEWQIAQFVRRTGIGCELIGEHDDIKVGDSCSTALFRILQESLSNIERHAQATQANVTLQFDSTRISMRITDNGIGIQPDGRNKLGSFGLVGIEERIRILGGTFSIVSVSGKGTTISVAVPLRDDENLVAEPAEPGARISPAEFA